MTTADLERFGSKILVGDECWPWVGSQKGNGYGAFSIARRPHIAHRVMYELVVGEIPDGFHIDHLCRNPNCVNPSHLEAVTPRTNILRGVGASAQHAAKTHCVNGHEFTPENTYLDKNDWRCCRACNRAKYWKRKAKRG